MLGSARYRVAISPAAAFAWARPIFHRQQYLAFVRFFEPACFRLLVLYKHQLNEQASIGMASYSCYVFFGSLDLYSLVPSLLRMLFFFNFFLFLFTFLGINSYAFILISFNSILFYFPFYCLCTFLFHL
jgi:hypothetical protein